ncbi:hypothetical protein Tco_0132486 [Tanacetum coccineum]
MVLPDGTGKIDALQSDKVRKIALSISKLKAARYLGGNFGLEELVTSLWVESEREYEISAVMASLTGGLGGMEFIFNKHRSGLRMTREEAKLSPQLIEKENDKDQKDLSKSR